MPIRGERDPREIFDDLIKLKAEKCAGIIKQKRSILLCSRIQVTMKNHIRRKAKGKTQEYAEEHKYRNFF